MFLRYEGGDFTSLLRENNKFILMLYFDGQQIDDEKTVSYLTILPSSHTFYPRTDFNVITDTFSGVTFVETYHSEAYDLVYHLGFNHDYLWDEENKIFRPLIIAVKDGYTLASSYGQCYCTETFMDVLIQLHPELFEPPGVSES